MLQSRHKNGQTSVNFSLTIRLKDGGYRTMEHVVRTSSFQHTKCRGESSSLTTIDRFFYQNFFVDIIKRLFALRTWFSERNNFTYGSHRNDLKVVGHYTQMIWAATHKVGCGLAKCPSGGPKNKPFFNYVCNYCPM